MVLQASCYTDSTHFGRSSNPLCRPQISLWNAVFCSPHFLLGFLSNIGQRFGFLGVLLGRYGYKNCQILVVGYCTIGAIYRRFNRIFKKYRHDNPPLSSAYFYLSMLFAATLLLSLTVLSQFIVYNAAPALLIITTNWWQMRKGYST